MAKEQRLSEEELQSINQLRKANQQLTIEFGQIHLSEKQLEERKKQAENTWEEIKNKEEELLNELRDKYQDGSIDLDKGVFIPNDEPQQQQKQPQNDEVVETAFD